MAEHHRVPARYYAHLCAVLAQSGIDTRALLSVAGIAQHEVMAPDGQLNMPQVEALLVAVSRATRRVDLAIDLGGALKLTSHSTVSYGILSSPTAGYALRLVARFFRLILPSFCMHYALDATAMQITVEPQWPMSHACLAFHLELIAVAVYREVGELLGGEAPPTQLYFSLHEPLHASRYTELRKLRVHFGWRVRPGFHMRWPLDVAQRPLALADSTALKLAEQRCSEMVGRARITGDVAGWVEMMLREASDGVPSQTELAHTLNLSPRTLDRYLKKEGASYRDLSKRACHTKACKLLTDEWRSITQIGLELGYTDVSNFARAFKRECGVSPGAWRLQHAEAKW